VSIESAGTPAQAPLGQLLAGLLADPEVAADPIAVELAHVLAAPTGVSSGGHPYLQEAAYERFRDRVPHILAMGPRALAALDTVVRAAEAGGLDVSAAAKVVRGCVLTAAITAPSDLWLMRHVVGALRAVGVVERLLAGEAIDPAACDVSLHGERARADARELEADLTLLLSRGWLEPAPGRSELFVVASSPRARRGLEALGPTPRWPAGVSHVWRSAFVGEPVSGEERRALLEIGAQAPRRVDPAQDTWIASAEEVEAGFRLLPIVLGLRAAGHHARLAAGEPLDAATLAPADPPLGAAALAVLAACGVVEERDGGGFAATATGRRLGEKGAGPMGIIEAYHPYMARLDEILVHGRSAAGVTRGANIAASQDANRDSFLRANDALDAFCTDTGFTFRVFIEHAIGRGEATRQRYERAGEQLRYVGADLEDAAIDACLEEQARGRLPKDMVFVRGADIGNPGHLVRALKDQGLDPFGAVMIVGNGFHEVREQTDERMIDVFRGYGEAGILLLFTEESALRIDDLLTTAWNTYHAGFRYVHEKSGQGLRPAEPTAPSRFGRPLHKSWRECAEHAGYTRIERYSSRSRTVHPLAPRPRTNPSISANHFCVPNRVLEKLAVKP
jgi:hypothetical protein